MRSAWAAPPPKPLNETLPAPEEVSENEDDAVEREEPNVAIAALSVSVERAFRRIVQLSARQAMFVP